MKLVLAQFQHETNTFSPIRTTIDRFGSEGPLLGGEAVDALQHTTLPIAAFLRVAREHSAQVQVPIAAFAWPGGLVAREAFEEISGEIVKAVGSGCDGVLLDLHGAMVVEGYLDGEGELLRRIREVAPDVPIGVTLDFHANVSAEMVRFANVITGYRTYPHTDTYEAGDAAARLLIATIQGRIQPRIAWGWVPLLSHLLKQPPRDGPTGSMIRTIEHAENAGTVLSASIFPGFPLADTPYTGFSALAVVDGNLLPGERLVGNLLERAWDEREGFVFTAEPLESSIARAKSMDKGPVLLLDHCDNCGAGGTQDDMTVIREVVRQQLPDVAVGGVRDPEAVSYLTESVGIGKQATIQIGGKTDMPALGYRGEPLQLTGTVKAITDGKFSVTGPMFTGMKVDLGRSVLFVAGDLQIVLCEKAHEPFDLGIYTHIGIDPTRKRYLLLKSRVHYRSVFEPILVGTVPCAGRGVSTSDYSVLPFANLRRPMFPLDNFPTH